MEGFHWRAVMRNFGSIASCCLSCNVCHKFTTSFCSPPLMAWKPRTFCPLWLHSAFSKEKSCCCSLKSQPCSPSWGLPKPQPPEQAACGSGRKDGERVCPGPDIPMAIPVKGWNHISYTYQLCWQLFPPVSDLSSFLQPISSTSLLNEWLGPLRNTRVFLPLTVGLSIKESLWSNGDK